MKNKSLNFHNKSIDTTVYFGYDDSYKNINVILDIILIEVVNDEIK